MTPLPTTMVAVDFDGVVNALPMSEADLAHFERWRRRRVMGFPLTVAEEALDWLRTLPARGGEFHWATTWTPNRHLLDDAFGLPSRAPVAADPEAPIPDAPPGVSWKGAQIAARVADDPRPLVWLDDDALTDATAEILDTLAGRLHLPMLAVVTRMSTGLVPAQMALVDTFLAGARDGSLPPGLDITRANPGP